MNYRRQTGSGDLFAALQHQKEMSERTEGILKLRDRIAWEEFRPVLEEVTGYAKKDWRKGGRAPFDPVFMFQVLVLQKYHGLSDEATETQIKDRISFQSFLGLRMGDEMPDGNTIWDFKELIEAEGRDGNRRLFAAFAAKLAAKGLLAKEGSIVDASFIDAPKQRNSREENAEIKSGKIPSGWEKEPAKLAQKDLEARWSKKNQETHYGYKNHLKVDAKSKLIDTHTTTSASVHDSRVFTELVDANDQRVLADSAYHSQEHEEHLLACDAEEFLMRKSVRNHPLSEEEVQRNQRVSRVRVRIEHVFARMKQMGMDTVRCIGLRRARAHNTLSNLVYNLDRYVFLTRLQG
jgi:transposase, IS5 family